MDPETLARKRWRSARRELERRDQIGRQLAEARRASTELHRTLPEAEQRDRERRGRAVAEGKSRPPLEAPQIAAELDAVRQRVQDLEAAAVVVDQDLHKLRRDNRDAWGEQQAGKIEQAKRGVLAIAGELEAKVSAFEDEVALGAWITEAVDEARVDPAGGQLTHAGTITAALDQLRAAVAGLAGGETSPPLPKREGRKLAPMERPGWGR